MANNAESMNQPEEMDHSTGSIRLVIADTEPIFRVGMKKVFALEDDIRVVGQAENFGQTLGALSKFPCDVLLFGSMISPNPPDALSEIMKKFEGMRVVLVSHEMGEEETVEYLRRGVRGIVTRSISPDLLVKCVRKVASGETWLDNRGVNWVIEAYRAQASQLTSPRQKVRLSEKELLIIAGVTQGMKNKDIAAEIGTTEQVVKNYLRKIYDKLGVSDRLELALYCMHHRLLEGLRKNAASEPSPAQSPTPNGAVSQS